MHNKKRRGGNTQNRWKRINNFNEIRIRKRRFLKINKWKKYFSFWLDSLSRMPYFILLSLTNIFYPVTSSCTETHWTDKVFTYMCVLLQINLVSTEGPNIWMWIEKERKKEREKKKAWYIFRSDRHVTQKILIRYVAHKSFLFFLFFFSFWKCKQTPPLSKLLYWCTCTYIWYFAMIFLYFSFQKGPFERERERERQTLAKTLSLSGDRWL